MPARKKRKAATVKPASEKKIATAIDDTQKILSKFNLADAYYILGVLRVQTEMQMVSFEEE